MIAGIFHEGSGLGNQLHRYVATRVLAKDKGYEWGVINPENFKGIGFMNLYLGSSIPEGDDIYYWTRFNEKKIVENGVDVRGYDPEINFVKDNTIIDGEFQDPRYFEHRINEVREWLKVEPLTMPQDLCVIGFRGGEYYSDENLGLPKEYYDEAIEIMRKRNPNMRFEVHTDDTEMARQFFPGFKVIDNPKLSHSKNENMGLNWRAVRHAKNLIISNSSFYILPALLNENQPLTIAPKYWARRNTKTWALPQNYYRQFMYI